MNNTRTYLVVEPIPLVAEDLAQCIAEADPDARVIVARDAGDAVARVRGEGTILLAIVHESPRGFAGSDLGIALAGCGAMVVFMGDAAESHAALRATPATITLYRPFSGENVTDLLARITEKAPDEPSGA